MCIADVPNEHSIYPLDNELEGFKEAVEDVSNKLKNIKEL